MTLGEQDVLAYAVNLVNHWRAVPDQPRSVRERRLWEAVDSMQGEKTLPESGIDAIAAAARSHS